MSKVTFHELTIELCRREAGLEQVSIAQVKEIIGKLCDIVYENDGYLQLIIDRGRFRFQREEKRRKKS